VSDDIIDLDARRAAKNPPRGFRSWIENGAVCFGIGTMTWSFRDEAGADEAARRLRTCVAALQHARYKAEGKCWTCGEVKGKEDGQCHGHDRWRCVIHYGSAGAVCATSGRRVRLSLTWGGVTCVKCLKRKPKPV
jgi:hypothetical protein